MCNLPVLMYEGKITRACIVTLTPLQTSAKKQFKSFLLMFIGLSMSIDLAQIQWMRREFSHRKEASGFL